MMRRKRGLLESPGDGLRKKRRIILDGSFSNNSLESVLSSASNKMRKALEQLSSVNVEGTNQPKNVESQIDALRKLNRDLNTRIHFINRLWNRHQETKTSTPIVLDLTTTDDGNDSSASNESDSDLQIVQPSAMVSPRKDLVTFVDQSFHGHNKISKNNNNYAQRTTRSSSVGDDHLAFDNSDGEETSNSTSSGESETDLGSDNSDAEETPSPFGEQNYKNTRMQPFSSPEYIDLSSPLHQSPVIPQPQSPLSSPPDSPENSLSPATGSPRHGYDVSAFSSPELAGISPPSLSPPPFFRSGSISSNNSCTTTSINRDVRNPYENVNNSASNGWESISSRNFRTTNKPIASRNSNISYISSAAPPTSTTNSHTITPNIPSYHNRASSSSHSNIHTPVQNHNLTTPSSSRRRPPTLNLLSDSVLSDDSEILNTILNNQNNNNNNNNNIHSSSNNNNNNIHSSSNNNTELNTGFDPYRPREHSTAGMTSYNERYIQRAPRATQERLKPNLFQRTNNRLGRYNCGTKPPRASWTGATFTENLNNHQNMTVSSSVITSDIPSNAPQNLNSSLNNSGRSMQMAVRSHPQVPPILPTRNEYNKRTRDSASNTTEPRQRLASRRQFPRPPHQRRFRQSSRLGRYNRRRNAITLRCLPHEHFGRAATDIAALVQMLYCGRRNDDTNITVSTRPTGAPRSAVQCLPVEKIRETPKVGERNCVICLEDFKAGDIAKRLPCFHRFHVKEIDKWLSRKNSCPVCKTPVT